MRLKQVILALFIVRFCVNISLSLLRFGIMVVREKNCYYAIALTDFFVFLSCAEQKGLGFKSPAGVSKTFTVRLPDQIYQVFYSVFDSRGQHNPSINHLPQ